MTYDQEDLPEKNVCSNVISGPFLLSFSIYKKCKKIGLLDQGKLPALV